MTWQDCRERVANLGATTWGVRPGVTMPWGRTSALGPTDGAVTMGREHEEDTFRCICVVRRTRPAYFTPSLCASGRVRLTLLAMLAAAITFLVVAGVIAGRAIYSLVGYEDAASRVAWTGVVDRVESGQAVVIPLRDTRGVDALDGGLSFSEVVIPADLLPPASHEGAVLDFAATLRPHKTHSRRAHIEALVLRLNNRGRESPGAGSRGVPSAEAR
ncbi:MAG: DUF3006 domain-containing protein [Synergistales bacterium]|nr:DUF3006 domain-containing protein [Synergistales bacterium]